MPCVAFVSMLLAIQAVADDWPQWMGPARDNVWKEEGILTQFPASGLEVAWRAPLAGGYAGPAVAGGRVFVTDFMKTDGMNGTERVLCLDAATGQPLWQHEEPETYTISYPAGPRCTPLVDDDLVYTLGAEGKLLCLAVSDGTLIWSRDLKADYQTKAATWGYASHPLIDGDKLICIAGTNVAHAVALNKHTGKEIWRTGTAPEQGYCPPVIIEAAGVRQLILMKPDGMYAVDPETGTPFWETPYNADNGSIIMQPVRIGDYLYIGGFQEKNLLLKLRSDAPGVDVVWRNKRQHGISAVNVQPFVLDGSLCGFHEKGDLRIVEIPSGEVVFSAGGPLPGRLQGCGTAFITQHRDRFFFFTETGDLVIAQISTEGYTELDRTHLIAPTNTAFGRDVVWCPPAYADRAVFVRNDREIIRASLAAKTE
jgi:outer membrane protein assembly factor BamB